MRGRGRRRGAGTGRRGPGRRGGRPGRRRARERPGGQPDQPHRPLRLGGGGGHPDRGRRPDRLRPDRAPAIAGGWCTGSRPRARWWPSSTRSPARSSTAVGVTRRRSPLVAPTVLVHQPPLHRPGSPRSSSSGPSSARSAPRSGGRSSWPWPGSGTSPCSTTCSRRSSRSSPPSRPSASWGRRTPADYVTFTGVELYSDSIDAHGAFTRIATLTPSQSALVDRYGRPPGTGRGRRLPLRRRRQPDGHLDLRASARRCSQGTPSRPSPPT